MNFSGKDPNTLFVRCGDWDILRDVEPLPPQERGVSEVRIHPEHPREAMWFDDDQGVDSIETFLARVSA